MYANGRKTERLEFRALESGDVEAWESFFIDNPNLPYLGIELDKTARDNAAEWIDIQLNRYREGRYGHHALLLRETGKLIGQAGLLTQTIEGTQEIEIGYHILPEFWGQGFATEAAVFFRNFGFEHENLDHLVSMIDVRNLASQNVALKNGMLPRKQISYLGIDVLIFEINRIEWQNRPDGV